MALAAGFKLFGVSHLGVLASMLVVSVLLVIAARKINSPRLTKAICWAIAAILLANEAGYYVRGLGSTTWMGFVRSYLPLHLCGIALYMTIATLITRRQLIFEMACFWGLIGTPQAILTPTLEFGFPDYWFWQFFICHCGIVVGVVFAIWAMGMRPRRGSMWRMMAITAACLVLIGVFDYLTGANYMYLREAPIAASPLVAWGWPWHIVIACVLMCVGFWLVDRLLGRSGPVAG